MPLPPSRPSNLPWLAALVALLAGLVPFLITLAMRGVDLGTGGAATAVSYASLIGSLIFRMGISFLIVQAHGERHGRLVFRRPLAVLAIFALCLLGWQALQITLTMGLARSLAGEGNFATIASLLAVFHPFLYTLGIWLSWIIAAGAMHKDAQPMPPAQVRWRTAGLIAWISASVLALGTPAMLVYAAMSLDGDYAQAAIACTGLIAVPAMIAFVGTWLGLPRELNRVGGWRVIGVIFAAVLSTALLVYGAYLGAMRGLSGDIASQSSLAIGLAVFSLAACFGMFCLWTWIVYVATRRQAAF
jgi:hypothetical protein